jgi:hypothetical protein
VAEFAPTSTLNLIRNHESGFDVKRDSVKLRVGSVGAYNGMTVEVTGILGPAALLVLDRTSMETYS